MTTLRSGQVARAVGVNPQTLRYYERRGLLAEPERSLGGHRLYPPKTVALLRMIRAARSLGFSLEEVGELLDTVRPAHRSCGGPRGEGRLRARAAAKLADVDATIAELNAVRAALLAALDAGCDDLIACSSSPCCPLPFDDPDGPKKSRGECVE